MVQFLCSLFNNYLLNIYLSSSLRDIVLKKKKNKDSAGWPGKEMTLQLSPEAHAERLGQKVLACSRNQRLERETVGEEIYNGGRCRRASGQRRQLSFILRTIESHKVARTLR